MQAFTVLTAKAAPVDVPKIDTGMIFPGRFGRKQRRPGSSDYADCFLHDLRFDSGGSPRPDFALNFATYQGARILITAADFGCGSSRETAVYATADFGVRALIGPSFGEIYYANCLQNGVLPVVLSTSAVAELFDKVKEMPGTELTIDLPKQIVRGPRGCQYRFDIDPTRKKRLMQGLDDVDITLQLGEKIALFEQHYYRTTPWAALE